MVTIPDHWNALDSDAAFCAQGDISGRRTPKKLIERGHGHYLFDTDGAAYLDFQLCNGAAPFGYANPEHVAAAAAQAHRLSALSSEFITPERSKLAQMLGRSFEASFGAKGRVHFSVGGAQAIDDALKLCTRYTGRQKVLAMEGGYHGRTIAASNISASYRYRSGFGYNRSSDLIPFPYCPRCPYDKRAADCGLFCLSQVRRLFASEAPGLIDGRGGTEIGAIFVESVLGRGGHVCMPFDYLRGLRQIADQFELLLVIDDIQMGLMRSGRMWTAEHADIVPDVVVFGKAITNGMFPTSGFWARDEIAGPENWPVGSSHATFSASPIGMALGLETMRMLEDPTLPGHMEKSGSRIEKTLNELRDSYPFVHAVNRCGLALSLDICDPGNGLPSPALAHEIVERALAGTYLSQGQRYGLVSTHGGMHGQMVMLAPPYRVNDAEIDLFAGILGEIMSDVERVR
jgi:4-aminobutyrate aminotransferase-like enzyme